MPTVVVVGEALVDLVPTRAKAWQFHARPGGAPANVAAELARLGQSVALVSRVGADAFGDYVLRALTEQRVMTHTIARDAHRPTTIAVASGAKGGDVFSIYFDATASACIAAVDVPHELIGRARALHIGTVSMSSACSREATWSAVYAAESAGVPVSLDVNLRSSVWHSTRQMVSTCRELIPHAAIVKVTVDELRTLRLTPSELLMLGPASVLVTDGARRAFVYATTGQSSELPPPSRVCDPTGAGDAFMAAMLDSILRESESALDWRGLKLEQWKRGLRAATMAGSAAVRRIGGTPPAEEAHDRRPS